MIGRSSRRSNAAWPAGERPRHHGEFHSRAHLQLSGLVDARPISGQGAGARSIDPLGYGFTPFAYAAGRVLAQAVEATKSLDQTKLADYIHTHSFHTVVGDIEYDKAEVGETAHLSRNFRTLSPTISNSSATARSSRSCGRRSTRRRNDLSVRQGARKMAVRRTPRMRCGAALSRSDAPQSRDRPALGIRYGSRVCSASPSGAAAPGTRNCSR